MFAATYRIFGRNYSNHSPNQASGNGPYNNLQSLLSSDDLKWEANETGLIDFLF